MTKVSVLVPICNVEKYLPACLDSLTKQSLKDLEIICIDDGSTDQSPKIIAEYAAQDHRIKVITKANSGYGDSMNQGLAAATGEYIGIVESDDFIDKTGFERLYDLAKSTKTDIVRANYYYYAAGRNELHHSIKNQPLDVATKLADHPEILYEEPAIWAGLYRAEFLRQNHIKFLATPGASYQDTGFNFKALCSAKSIAYTNKAYLHYRTDNANSSVKSLDKVNYVVKEFASIEQFLTERGASQKLLKTAQAAKFGAYHWNLQRLDGQLALDFCQTIKREFKKADKAGLLDKKFFPKKSWWRGLGIILRFPPRVYVSMLKARKKAKQLGA